MGTHLKEVGLVPDIVISSSALRAQETSEAVRRACGYEGEIDYRDELYLAEPNVYVTVLSQLSDDLSLPLFVGHNPILEDLLRVICGVHVPLSTATLAALSLPIDTWSEATASGDGTLEEVWSA